MVIGAEIVSTIDVENVWGTDEFTIGLTSFKFSTGDTTELIGGAMVATDGAVATGGDTKGAELARAEEPPLPTLCREVLSSGNELKELAKAGVESKLFIAQSNLAGFLTLTRWPQALY